MSGAPKRGLGRGLDALLGDAGATAPVSHHVREIPVSQITPNPFQPRKHFDPQSLRELQTSIAQYGVLIPVIVREGRAHFQLLAGERRWRACAALGRATTPAILRDGDDLDSRELSIIETLQRDDLNAL